VNAAVNAYTDWGLTTAANMDKHLPGLYIWHCEWQAKRQADPKEFCNFKFCAETHRTQFINKFLTGIK
ncbi:MAG: hypothetical protein L3J32_12920, partial [Rhizobiaceae bacterium]|nr:hypothetical protein [Rhizobiaceae bacterium]